MVDAGPIIVILVLDFVISVWNCYAAGFMFGMLRKNGGESWMKLTWPLGLAMGMAGMVYVLTMIFSLVAYSQGFINDVTVNLLLAYDFLITGGLIVVLGIGLTIQSLYVAVKKPDFWTIFGAGYNTFASIWNVFVYMRNFGLALDIVKAEERSVHKPNLGALIIIAAGATVLAVLLGYVAFHAGRNHANGTPVGKI